MIAAASCCSTLLARGEWADALEKNGLVIDPIFSPGKKAYRIPVIRELKEDDVFDAVFVVMRYTPYYPMFVCSASTESNLPSILNQQTIKHPLYASGGKQYRQYKMKIISKTLLLFCR